MVVRAAREMVERAVCGVVRARGRARGRAPSRGAAGELDLTILDRQFLRELVQNLAFTLMVITAIAVFALATVAFYRVPELGFLTYVQLVRFSLIQALSFLLPLSFLIAVVFVYGRAAADHEVTTLKASGIHPYRVMLPGLLLALLLAGIDVEVENRWVPWAIYQRDRVPEQHGTFQALLEARIANRESVFDFGDRDSHRWIHWNPDKVEVGERGLVLHDVIFRDEPEEKPGVAPAEPLIVRAKSAVVSVDPDARAIVLRLLQFEVLSGQVRGARTEALVITYPLSDPSSRTRLKFQSGAELFALAERGAQKVEVGGTLQPLLRRVDLDEVHGRIQERLARAATPIVFLLLGFPLALIFRSGNRMVAFLLASLIAMFVYYPTALLADLLMKQRLAGPVVACWSGNVLLAALGGGLLLFVVRR